MHILQRTCRNRWAEISSHILGRPDNSVKNYWNSNLKVSNSTYATKLDRYIKKCHELDHLSNFENTDARIERHLLNHLIRRTQSHYLDHLVYQLEELRMERDVSLSPNRKARDFKMKLLERALNMN